MTADQRMERMTATNMSALRASDWSGVLRLQICRPCGPLTGLAFYGYKYVGLTGLYTGLAFYGYKYVDPAGL